MTGFAFHLAAFGSSAGLTDSMAQAVPFDLQAQSDERLVTVSYTHLRAHETV